MIKRLKRIWIATPIILGMMWMQGCIHDDFDEPPLPDIPVGTVITIGELRDMFQGGGIVFDDDLSIFATVTMDDKSGNIYRSAFVEDGTGAINLRLQAPGGVYEGDSVRIYLRNTILSSYQQMLQLDNVNVDRNIIKIDTQKEVTPTLMSIPDIGPDTQGQLIKLEDVQFVNEHVGLPFADSENLLTINRMLEDCSGNRIIVRTSGYANFADHAIPEGNGTLVGVVAQYRQDMQLYIRRMSEVELDGERCAIPGDDYDLITLQELRENYYNGITSIPPNTRVQGVVISDDANSNHPRQNLFMMDDSEHGMVIRFAENQDHGHALGTELRVIVSNMEVSEFNGLLQIDNTPPGNAYNLGPTDLPEPKERTIQEIKDNINMYQSTLVRIQGVTVSGGNTFSGARTITDATGSMMLFTHNWASFANSPLPSGTVTITGIVSFHFDPELMIRNLNDITEE